MLRTSWTHLLRCISTSLIFATAMGHQGCATYTAVTIPGDVPDDRVQVGMHRAEVEGLVGGTKTSEFTDVTGTTVQYAYIDGVHQASKARVIIYLAGDFFTLFLSELVFWPIEAYAKNQMKRLGTAYYDTTNRILDWVVSRPGG